jgi:hypothetical protein
MISSAGTGTANMAATSVLFFRLAVVKQLMSKLDVGVFKWLGFSRKTWLRSVLYNLKGWGSMEFYKYFLSKYIQL